jgi:hypothetical protein
LVIALLAGSRLRNCFCGNTRLETKVFRRENPSHHVSVLPHASGFVALTSLLSGEKEDLFVLRTGVGGLTDM